MYERSPRLRLFLLVLLITGACRKAHPPLEAPQAMAYRVKPAVVRVKSVATAEFRYSKDLLLRVISGLEKAGLKAGRPAASLPDTLVVRTGAGGSGSGFVVHPSGWVFTSGHVAALTRDRARLEDELRRNGAALALAEHIDREILVALQEQDALARIVTSFGERGELSSVAVVDEVELSNGDRARFEVVQFSPSIQQGGTDLALLRIDRSGLPTLPLADSASTRIGTNIWAAGYPSVASSSDEVMGQWLSRETDLEATFNPGTITAIRRTSGGGEILQTNAAIYRGNSGGPVVNAAGEVAGISTLGHTTADQIKFLVPAARAKQMLLSAGVKPGVSSDFDRHYAAALDAASRGEWVGARNELARATLLFRGSPDVLRFRQDVDRAIETLPVWQRSPQLTALAGAALVIAIAAFVVVKLRSRPHRSETQPTAMPPGPEFIVRPGRKIADHTDSPVQTLGRLTILSGEHAGERFGLAGSGIRIGRESELCEIVLENPKVSRLHAEVVAIDGQIMLIDRDSSNGTYVNDRKIQRQYLSDGDIIHFGGRNAVAAAFNG